MKFSLNLNFLTQGAFWSPDIHSSKHKDRRKGSLDVRSTSRGSDGEGEGRQMLLLVYKTLSSVFVLIGHWLENQIHLCCCSNLRLFFLCVASALPGSSQRRHSSMARIHSMTIEAPITKVGLPDSLSYAIKGLSYHSAFVINPFMWRINVWFMTLPKLPWEHMMCERGLWIHRTC